MKKLAFAILFLFTASTCRASGLDKEDYAAGYIASIATSIIVAVALIVQSYRMDGVEFEIDPEDEEQPIKIEIHW